MTTLSLRKRQPATRATRRFRPTLQFNIPTGEVTPDMPAASTLIGSYCWQPEFNRFDRILGVKNGEWQVQNMDTYNHLHYPCALPKAELSPEYAPIKALNARGRHEVLAVLRFLCNWMF